MITGFLESVCCEEARGWAFDSESPEKRLEVLLYDGQRILGRTRADIYRHDLRTPELGDGEHAFVLRFKAPVEVDIIGSIFAEVEGVGSSPVRLERLPPNSGDSSVENYNDPIYWDNKNIDKDASPLFILGAARSGTTAVAHALFETLEYAGNEEGHIFDLFASFAVSLRRFWELKSDDWSSNRNTTIRRVPVEYMEQALNSILVELGRSLFGVRPWLDKTPTSDMIHLAPRFLHIWPKAKFIFMRRRGIDNILSRQRKFNYDFERNCREWANAMSAWAATRDKLQGSFIELDQADMASNPNDAARSISYLLALGEVDTRRLARRLFVDHPQRTGGLANIVTSLTATSWTADQVSSFRRIAGPMMAFYGYREE